MSPKALIIGSNGSEDIELIVTSDVLRRAGVEVTIAGLQDEPTIQCSRNAKLNVDALFKDVQDQTYDAVILPGGQPGSNNLAADERVGSMLNRHEQAGKIVAAICAAPIAFASHKVAIGGILTSYPGVKDKIVGAGYTYTEDKVSVWNNNVVTSRGPGTSFDFALKLVELLVDADKSQEIREGLLL